MTALAAAGTGDLIVQHSCLRLYQFLAGSYKTKPPHSSFLLARSALKGLILQSSYFSLAHYLRRSSFPFPARPGPMGFILKSWQEHGNFSQSAGKIKGRCCHTYHCISHAKLWLPSIPTPLYLSERCLVLVSLSLALSSSSILHFLETLRRKHIWVFLNLSSIAHEGRSWQHA